MLEDQNTIIELATELTVAWLSNANTRVHAEDVPAFLARMHQALNSLAAPETPATAEPVLAPEYTPAVSVRKSLASKDYIVSMIDGKAYKTLRRHLASDGLTPDEYRQRYHLKADYPMVAESYSHHRREMAKRIGLGRKPRQGAAAGAEPDAETPRRRRGKGAGGEPDNG